MKPILGVRTCEPDYERERARCGDDCIVDISMDQDERVLVCVICEEDDEVLEVRGDYDCRRCHPDAFVGWCVGCQEPDATCECKEDGR